MPRPQNPRRGSLYLSVLGTALLVSIAGLAAIHVARTELRAATGDADIDAARSAADAGVAYALDCLDEFPDWRNAFRAGELLPNRPVELGRGEFQFILDAGLDPDGNPISLRDATASPLTIRGIGRVGRAVSVTEVTIAPDEQGVDSLDAAIAARENITLATPPLPGEGTLTVNHPVFAGGSIDIADGVELKGDAIAVNTVTGNVTGSVDENARARQFPDSQTVFDYYLRRGTWISIDSIRSVNGLHIISNEAIGPGRNPYGEETNPEGIYIIDCKTRSIEIRATRIVGTLVLIDNGDATTIGGNMGPSFNAVATEVINFEPFAEAFPALMVENNVSFTYDSNKILDEFDLDTNFNPPGVPLNGVEDNDRNSSYPSEIKGLVYVGGKLTVASQTSARVDGVVMTNTLLTESAFDVRFRDRHLNFPPPGFEGEGEVALQIGSWRRGENRSP